MAGNYRWNITGHEKQLGELERDLESGNLPHAYLFTGPPKVGKFTLAKRLAKILQCGDKGCGACAVCVNIEKGYHPDTLEIADDGETIKIETMRNILARLATTTPARHKILLMKNIERMTAETANALLKTLEEPPSQVVFLFTCSEPDSVLPTILSRVRTLKFRSLTTGKVLDFLTERYPLESAEKLRKVADLSFGLTGKALALLGNEELFNASSALLERVGNVLRRGETVEKFALVSEVTAEDATLKEFLDIFLLALRYRMIEDAENGGDRPKLRRTLKALARAQESIRLQKRNVNARLLFENLMLQT